MAVGGSEPPSAVLNERSFKTSEVPPGGGPGQPAPTVLTG